MEQPIPLPKLQPLLVGQSQTIIPSIQPTLISSIQPTLIPSIQPTLIQPLTIQPSPRPIQPLQPLTIQSLKPIQPLQPLTAIQSPKPIQPLTAIQSPKPIQPLIIQPSPKPIQPTLIQPSPKPIQPLIIQPITTVQSSRMIPSLQPTLIQPASIQSPKPIQPASIQSPKPIQPISAVQSPKPIQPISINEILSSIPVKTVPQLPELPQLPRAPLLSQPMMPVVPSGLVEPMSFIKMQPISQIPSILPKRGVAEDIPTKPLPEVKVIPTVQRTPPMTKIPGRVDLPKGTTIIPKVPIIVPEIVSGQVFGSLAYTHDIEHGKQVILDQIIANKHMLVKKKTSDKNKGYNLEQLKNFARQLGINVNQNKGALIDAIIELINKRQRS